MDEDDTAELFRGGLEEVLERKRDAVEVQVRY